MNWSEVFWEPSCEDNGRALGHYFDGFAAIFSRDELGKVYTGSGCHFLAILKYAA